MIHFNCNTLQHICKRYQKYALQHTATHRNILQQHTSTATHCNTLVKLLESQLYGHFMKHHETHFAMNSFWKKINSPMFFLSAAILGNATVTATRTRPAIGVFVGLFGVPMMLFLCVCLRLSWKILSSLPHAHDLLKVYLSGSVGVFVGLFWCICRALLVCL